MDDDEITEIPSIKARPIDYVVSFLIFLNNVAEACDDFTNMLITITARHANYKHDQAAFADAIRADLESIPTEETR